MKAKLKTVTEFKPIVIEITLETAEEAASLRSLFNYSPIVDMAENVGIDLTVIRGAIPKKHSKEESWLDFIGRLKGEE